MCFALSIFIGSAFNTQQIEGTNIHTHIYIHTHINTCIHTDKFVVWQIWEVLKSETANRQTSIEQCLELAPYPTDEWLKMDPTHDEDDDEEDRSYLGSGNFATTRRMRGKDGTQLEGKVFAVKCIDMKKLRKQPVTDEQIAQESRILEKLAHPHIVTYFASYKSSKNKEMCIVMELATGGSLTDRIAVDSQGKQKPNFASAPSLEQTRVWIHQAAHALDYIHLYKIYHRDVKADNLLISAKGHILLADFGVAKAITSTMGGVAGTMAGTPKYYSPEKARGRNVHDGKDDIWGLGCVLCELVAQHELTNSIWDDSLEVTKTREALISDVMTRSAELGEWASKMLQLDPTQRWSAAQLLAAQSVSFHLLCIESTHA